MVKSPEVITCLQTKAHFQKQDFSHNLVVVLLNQVHFFFPNVYFKRWIPNFAKQQNFLQQRGWVTPHLIRPLFHFLFSLTLTSVTLVSFFKYGFVWCFKREQMNGFEQKHTESDSSCSGGQITFSFIMESQHIFSPRASGTGSKPISLAL